MAFMMRAAEVWRDFVTGGIPSSGKWNPKKSDIRAWGAWIEEIISSFLSTGGKIYQTLALLNADLAPAANSTAWVMEDATVANNGIYRKVGASGSGYWVRAGDLPYSFIFASNTGAGAPNAILATTSIPVSPSALVLLQIAEDYTGVSATVSFNGGAPLAIKSNAGQDVTHLEAGSVLYGVISGSTFRLSNDETIASLIFDARDEAQDARDEAVPAAQTATVKASEALASATVAAGYAAAAGVSRVFSTKADADAALSSVAANAFVKVLVDESQADVETIYQKVSGSYVLKAKAGQKEVRLENFGAMLDGSTDDSAAVLSAISWVSANGGRIIGTGGKTCYCASLIDLTGIDFFSERDFKFRGNIDLSKENSTLLADLNVDIDSAGVKYPYKMPRGFRKPFAEKGLWLGASDLIRDRYARIDPGSLNKVKVAHPGGDTFSTDVLPIAADQTISWNLTAGGEWHCGLRPAIGGRELSAVFSAGDYARAAFFVWSGGWIAIAAGQSSIGATVYKKDIGVAITSSNINWRGTANHPQWLAVNSEWTVRLYDERTAALVMNGTEVYRFNLPAGAIITEYGFGVLASGPAINAGISRWTERRASVFGGQNQTSISVFGDSKSSPFYGVWLDACREALDATYGIRCANIVNNAVAGENSLSVLQRMQSVGLGIANYVVIYCGTNDIQGGSPLSASLQNLSDMLDIVVNAGRVPVVVIPSLWLNANQTPDGFATANAENGAELRAAYRTMGASRGALIVDVQQITGQILSDFITSPDLSDARVRDRIHDTAFVYRLVGQMIARVIAGDIAKQASPRISAIPMPVRYFANGWYSTLRDPYVTVDQDRFVQMEGILEAGTKTDGTTIIALPVNVRPGRSRSFVAFSIRSSDGRRSGILLEITSGGDLKIYGMPSDDNYVYLDPVRFEAA